MSTCKCGKTLISKTTDLLINGSSQPIALNIASLVGTPKDILLESGQVFSTVTNKLNYQIGGGVGNTVIINTKLVIDHQIKVVIKTESGRVLGVKYVGSFNKQTVVDNIQFSSSDLIPYLTNDERLIIQFHSMCDFSTSDCCDKLPDFTITNILNTFCVRPTTTTTTSTTLPPTYCFDSWYNNSVWAVGTIYGSSSFTTWNAGYGNENIYLLKQDNFGYFYRLTSPFSGFVVGETITLNFVDGISGTYILIEKIQITMNTNIGDVEVMWHKLACVTDTTTTGTTTTGTTTTGTTTTGTTTTGTTTTGTTTTGTTTTGTTTTGTTTTGTTTTGTTTTGTTTTGTTTTGTTTTGTTTTCAPWPTASEICNSSPQDYCEYIEKICIDCNRDGFINSDGEYPECNNAGLPCTSGCYLDYLNEGFGIGLISKSCTELYCTIQWDELFLLWIQTQSCFNIPTPCGPAPCNECDYVSQSPGEYNGQVVQLPCQCGGY